MSLDSGDPAIKLFGRTIPLSSYGGGGGGGDGGGGANDKGISIKDSTASEPNTENKDEEMKGCQVDEESAPFSPLAIEGKDEEQDKDSTNSHEKPMKKPDKILSCPRCSSLDTKFCYFNNYNVNQPRHFCKNCQRYWTAGGTMRNVPVGAGRRKSKNSLSHYKHLNVPNPSCQTLATNPNATVLTFGPEMPLCESMASVLNLADRTTKSSNINGFHHMENGEYSDEHSSSSPTETNLQAPAAMRNSFGFPCFNGSQWPTQWSPIPVPIYPATAYWTTPWFSPLTAAPMNPGSSGTAPNSPILGKHTRDGNVLIDGSNSDKGDTPRKSDPERRIWIPKTLRIDDPGEAAMSSIWASIGIKNENADGVHGGGLFKACHPKTDIKQHSTEPSPAWHANPAALSRSHNFHESS
ncbi:hypothetical protein J5N97_005785 [Dioscorea zingiberensis]|uniref:Dof-type domain-containing protein n=1 Tax=Dioscorea zingiberensis TaxID=325984 RepID=A0A9D5DAE6_9LILI|nr:hypothetical protein J5N97_005785 [Dioscorea zingiberensis]